MDEAVWIAIGVIAIILGLTIFINLLSNYQQGDWTQSVKDATTQLQAECQLVCKAPKETMLSIDITLPSGALVTTQDDRICIRYEGQLACERCACPFAEETVLNLTSEETRRLFREHTYTCAFHHGDTINVTCQG